jgi:hypothetical protein
MGIFVGKGERRDVTVTGVVGSTRSSDGDSDDEPMSCKRANKIHTGVTHLGKGSVYINGKKQ